MPDFDMSEISPETEPSAAQFLPPDLTYPALVDAAARCRGCDLYKHATQTVFGEGPVKHGSLMLVGEQPGDEEDKAGHPFVGPAGALLNKGLEEAGVPRQKVYVTNAVKHFRFEERGKRRMHKSPSARHIKACKPWLETEMLLIRPKAIICLGATAAKSMLGNGFSITQHRGDWYEGLWKIPVMATFHPSAALRAPDHERRAEVYNFIVEDLRKASALL